MSSWLGLLWALRAFGGAPVEPPAASFGTAVVVVGERAPTPLAEVPAAVSRFERVQIDRLPADTLAELLERLPGFSVLQPEGLGGVPMVGARGFFGGGEAEYVQLRIDGVPVSDPESGLADWRAVRAFEIERVEALRGPAAAYYGDAALAGVVDVVTRPPAGEPRLDLAGSGGGFGTLGLDLRASPAAGGPLPAMSAGGFRTEGYRRHSAQRELALGLAHAAAGWSVDLDGTERRREEPGPLDAAAFAEDRRSSDQRFDDDLERSRRARAALTYASGTTPARFSLFGSTRATDVVRTLLLAPELADTRLRRIDTDAVGLSASTARTGSWLDRELLVRAGVDLAREWMRTGYRSWQAGIAGPEDARAGARRDRGAVFLHGGWQAARRLRLSAGGRWDGIRDSPSGGEPRELGAWSPRLGATLDLSGPEGARRGTTTVFVQLARAFRAPTLDQRYDPRPFPAGDGGSFLVSNPELGPQRARTLELGLRHESRRLAGELALYHTEVDDEIDFDIASFRYLNLGSTRHRGAELALRTGSAGPLRAALDYAWTEVEPRHGEQRGRQLKNVACHRGRLAAGLSRPRGWDLDLAAAYVGRRYLDDAERFAVPPAWRLDLRLARTLGAARWRLDVLNALDGEDVAVGYVLTSLTGVPTPLVYPAPGRAWRVGLEIGF